MHRPYRQWVPVSIQAAARVLACHAVVGSMGRIAAAENNTAMKSSTALPQNKALDHRNWATREQLRIAIATGLERTYHRRRAKIPSND